LKDEGKSSDIFITAYPEGQDPQPTETHWKCTNGNGVFNWRLKYPMVLPSPALPTFKVQVWDRNVVHADAVICEANINLRSLYQRAIKKGSDREFIGKQWVALKHPKAPGIQGEVQISFELLTKSESVKSPAGFGREDPNMNPNLPEPKRPETSFAPWNVAKQTEQVVKATKGWWQGFRIKLIAAVICLVIVIVLILLWQIARIF